MPEQSLIIVGASARAAAFSARRAGLQPWCIDLFADADLQKRCPVQAVPMPGYPRNIGPAMRSAPPGPWLYTGGLENYPELIDRWARVRPLWGNAGAVLREVRNPVRLFEALTRAGLPAIETTFEAPDDVGWLEKPLRGAGGAGIREWQPAVKPRSGCYYQRWVNNASMSAVYCGMGGKAYLLGVTRQLVGEDWVRAGPYRYCGSIGPIDPGVTIRRQWQSIGQTLAETFQLKGLFGVDAIVLGERVWPVEVNPRYSASIEVLEYASGLQAMDWHRAAFAGGNPALPNPTGVCGKAILFADRDIRIEDEDIWIGKAAAGPNQMPSFADVPASGSQIQAGWPIMTVLANGNTPDEVLLSLRYHAVVAYDQLYGPVGSDPL